MEHAHRLALRRTLVALDAATIVIAMAAAMFIHTSLRQHFAVFKTPPALELYLLLAYLTLPMWLALAAVLGLYRQLERPTRPGDLLRDLLRLHLFGLLGLSLLIYVTQIYMNRSVVALFILLTLCLMFANRLILQAWIQSEYLRGHYHQRMLLVTDSKATLTEISAKLSSQLFPPRLVGCLVPESTRADASDWTAPILGRVTHIRRVLHDNAIDLVFVSCSREVVVDIDSLLEACDEVGVPLRCHVRVDHSGAHAIQVVDSISLPSIAFEMKTRSAEALIVKRFIDIVAGSLLLLLLLPLLALVGLAIWVTMGRPILVAQTRTGYNGRTFTMYKFRTMVRDAEQRRQALEKCNEVDGPAFKIRSDPRITPVGRLFRRTSIDELPQLFNVVAGSMSLVGPRPLIVGEQQSISGPQRRRLSMKPGMTGLWQVSGRSNLTFDEWMKLDLQYVDNWTLGTDVRLLLQTIPAVLSGRGAV